MAPPQPVFDIDLATGNAIKKQANGRISWSAFLVPEKPAGLTTAPATRFRSHVVVYRDRFLDTTTPASPANPNPLQTSAYGIYTTSMTAADAANQLNIRIAGTQTNSVPREEMVTGDWIMLVNRIPEPENAGIPVHSGMRAADQGYRIQLGFGRITRINDNGTDGTNGTALDITDDIVTIDGSDFDFVTPGLNGAAGGPPSSITYMVHLRNAVNVYERSISVER